MIQRLGVEPRRRAILAAAGEAFAGTPYDRVSVARVAASAGVSEALVHKYFGSKPGLYVAVVQIAVRRLLDRQRRADAELGPDAPPRRRLARSIEVYLDSIEAWAGGWAGPFQSPSTEPAEAARLRADTRRGYVELLRDVLGLAAAPALDYTLAGYLGFLDAACLAWVRAGHPADHRAAIVEAALAALDGALAAVGHPGALD